jgi:TolB-like protein/Flp pilus assembly protein TadD
MPISRSVTSFLGELKRRKVFRAAAAYAVVAFVVIQAAQLLIDALSLPAWSLPLITVLAILGFPLALVLSWAFDLTEEGIRRDGAAAAASPALGAPVVVERSIPPERSIAVLPFANLSGDDKDDYFSDGITEDIINGLSHLRDLRVISRTSVMRYKGAQVSVGQIAKDLGVATVLEGSVRRAGDRVRISAKLIDALEDRHLWVESYDHSLRDVFAIQSDVSNRIAKALAGELSVEEKRDLSRRPTEDVEAYDLYLRGRSLWSRRTAEGIDKSIEYYQGALLRDPDCALAHAGLADSYVTLGIYGARAPDELMPLAEQSARRALELDPRSGEALTALAAVRSLYHWDWAGAEQDYLRSMELQPQYPVAHQWYGSNLLTPLRRFDEALAAIGRARDLDPFGAAVATSRAVIHLYAGDFDRALATLDEVLDVHDYFGMAFYFRGMALEAAGRSDEAVDSLEKAVALTDSSSEAMAALGHAQATAGKTEAARRILADLESRFERAYGSPALLSQIHVALGDHDRALDLLDDAVEKRAADLIWLAVRPAYRPLRDHPRFETLVERVGLTSR